MSPVKAGLLGIAQQLPDDCTWDDVMDQVYVRQKIEYGLREADAGNLIEHDEVFAEFGE